ncbi:MAG: efflux RND transporter periplasmic adaptor subunit [Candidatus Riflebacteria bacterium]|nr:efflux RND transporter periplasmic adaptor subunit [Candidatus Riflebacteria bacterium]
MKKKILLVVLLIGIPLAIAGWYFTRSASGPRTYSTEEITIGNIRTFISASGSLAAITTVEVGSQLSGNIEKLYADFNDEVKAGQLVAQLEDSTYKAQLLQAKANLESANATELGIQAQVKNLQASQLTAKAEIQVSLANIRKAEVALEDADRNYSRFKELFERKLVAASERDSALTALESQKASLEVTRAQHESAKAKEMAIAAQFEALEADRAGAKARIRQMEAQLSVSQINLDRTSIYSPIDGVVISRAVDEGQTVAASLQAPKLFVIAQDLKKMQIDTAVDEADIGSVVAGQKVSFTVDAYRNRTFKGVVDQVRLSPQENANVVTYSVMVRVDNDDLVLKPGMTANAEIITGDRSDVLRLPGKALYFKAPDDMAKLARQQRQENGRLATDTLPVWILDESGKPQFKTAKIGLSNQDYIEILDKELKEGDKAIVGVQGVASNDNSGINTRDIRRATRRM